ncbi:translation initiation factor IF-2, partial [Escherichia coli]|nr:translation initiation factor IF-2 [Escherichia coli]
PVDGAAEGVIIESVLDKRAGVLATVLVQKGTLRVADYLVSGEVWAKIRRMTDEAGKAITEAGPSVPVQILGFSEQPVAGDRIVAVSDEVSAKALVAERRTSREDAEEDDSAKKTLTIADLFNKPKVTRINLI